MSKTISQEKASEILQQSRSRKTTFRGTVRVPKAQGIRAAQGRLNTQAGKAEKKRRLNTQAGKVEAKRMTLEKCIEKKEELLKSLKIRHDCIGRALRDYAGNDDFKQIIEEDDTCNQNKINETGLKLREMRKELKKLEKRALTQEKNSYVSCRFSWRF